jgi:hypothetical protein
MTRLSVLFVVALLWGCASHVREVAEETSAPEEEPAVVSWVGEPDEAGALALTRALEIERRRGAGGYDGLIPPATKVESVERGAGKVRAAFSVHLGYRRWYPEEAARLQALVAEALGVDREALEVVVRYPAGRSRVNDVAFEHHVTSPAHIRAREQERAVDGPRLTAPVVQRPEYAGPTPTAGLAGRHLVIAPSHGWTWHMENRWQFQRCRLHTTIEDLFSPAYILPFLMPMLENAGGVVYSARERDWNTEEVIVDNDGLRDKSQFLASGAWETGPASGWRGGRPASLNEGDEPFRQGTTLRAPVEARVSEALYVPYIPRDGRYAVSMSWAHAPENSPSVPVTIRHAGGQTTVRVNQQASGGTWVVLGFFEFVQGADPEKGAVVISTNGATPSGRGGATYVTADAVRFGGGMGNVAVDGQISGKPRYAEAARYFLQYAGAPADSVFLRGGPPQHFGVDYARDYFSRSEWPNYLFGRPNGPNNGWRDTDGLNVPVDLYLSWHSDAGVDHKGLVGTHMIYSVTDGEGGAVFPDGRSRWLNRDLAVLLDDEIVRAARGLYTSTWARRHVHNRALAETSRPNVPSALIELLSHQNMNDMKYGLDPRFKFDMARAVYKALLRFVAYSNGYEPVIQPLAPTHVAARHLGNGRVELVWRERPDPLEPSAVAESYIVYTSRDGRSFDNGRPAQASPFVVQVPEGEAHYFRVTAANAGGESFPSRLVGVRWVDGRQPILIVDGFDRVGGPAYHEDEATAGFDRDLDPGVGWHWNYGVVGNVYNYDRTSDWVDDLEAPGWGASNSDMENHLERGNGFDHIATWGRAAQEAGLAFDSALAETFADAMPAGSWPMIAWCAGLQRTTPPPTGMPAMGNPDRMATAFEVLPPTARARLREHVHGGGKLLISGAYVAEDLLDGPESSPDSRRFAAETLGIAGYVSRATQTNAVRATGPFGEVKPLRFGATLDPAINLLEPTMAVPSAEALTPAAGGTVVLEYGDGGRAAGIASTNVVVLGFPLETVHPFDRRAALLQAAAEHLGVAE